jgi:hypothetical protein
MANTSGSSKPKSSRFKGVTWLKYNQVWRARLGVNWRQVSLGCYQSEVEAAKAYNQAAIQVWGPFAKLNTIETE